MASLHISCFIFLLFHMMNVQTAPRSMRSYNKNNANVLIFEDNNVGNIKTLNNIQNLPNNLSQRLASEINKNARLTSINKSTKPLNSFPFYSFPFLDDMRQNWGIAVDKTNFEDEDEENYRRPINIPKPTPDDQIKPTIETLTRESESKPLLEKTYRALVKENKKNSVESEVKKNIAKPTSCDVAFIVCCMKNSNLDQCFREQGCLREIIPGTVCNRNKMYIVLQKLGKYYNNLLQ